MPIIILSIESSCDETAIAITRDGQLLCNIVSTQIEVHAKYGGVMPEIASRLHTENILIVLKEALDKANVTLNDIDAFAVTRGPGLIGALHVGMQTAKTLAFLYNKPLIPVHHLAGHIYANEFVKPLQFPFLGIIVSGGNTEFVLMKEHLDFQIIGETKDDAIGECYDKVARVLGLGYPGGIPIDKLASKGKHTYKLPTPHIEGYDFSFSGLKTSVINLVNNAKQRGEEINVEDLCTSFQETAMNVIINKALAAIKEYGVKQVGIGGGVSANSYLRANIVKQISDLNVDVVIPPMWCCTDQAAMIGKLAHYLYDKKIFAPLNVSVDPNWMIDDYLSF